jgi:hypothetical protein
VTRSRASARRRAGRSSARRTGRVAAAGTDCRDGVRHSHRVVTAGPSRTPTVRAVAIRACRRAPRRESAGRRWDNRGGGQSLSAPRTTRPAGLRFPPSRGPAPFMRTLAGMPAPPGLTPPPPPGGCARGMHAVASPITAARRGGMAPARRRGTSQHGDTPRRRRPRSHRPHRGRRDQPRATEASHRRRRRRGGAVAPDRREASGPRGAVGRPRAAAPAKRCRTSSAR